MNKALLVLVFVMLALPFAQAVTSGHISPIFECWDNNGDGTYTAHFGYENTYGVDMQMSSSLTGNYMSHSAIPQVFTYPASPNYYPARMGRTMFYNTDGTEAFHVVWDGTGNIVWSLDGRTATASTGNDNQMCTYVPPQEVPEFGVFAAIGVLVAAGLFVARRRQ